MQDKIKEIRTCLRLAMNGVVSQSMREKGVIYKLNFGVILPDLRVIAAKFEKETALADALWKEDIREFKILATLLQPAEEFTRQQAMQWITDVSHHEIAGQLCINLLKDLAYAEHLVLECYFKEEGYCRIIAFLLVAELCKAGYKLKGYTIYGLLGVGRYVMDQGVSLQQQAAMVALKQFGRQSPGQAAQVLSIVEEYKGSGCPEQEEFYNDLKFEFEYYH